MDIVHTCLNVGDAEASVQWYVGQLGFKETWSFETSDGETVNHFVASPNGMEIQLSDTEGQKLTEHGDAFDHFAVAVDDLDTAFADIDNHGVVQEPQVQPATGSRTAFVKDPDGHIIELVERSEE